MWALIVAWGDVLIAVAGVIGGIVIENKFGVYPKIKAAYDWVRAKF